MTWRAAEHAVLGAMVTGALVLGDLRAHMLEDLFVSQANLVLAKVLLSCIETRSATRRRPGIPLSWALAVLEHVDLPQYGGLYRRAGSTKVEARGFLPMLARSAPRRLDALAALWELIERARDREDARGTRERSLASLGDLVPASLVALREEDLAEVLARVRARRSRMATA